MPGKEEATGITHLPWLYERHGYNNNNNKGAFLELDYKKMTKALYNKIVETPYSTKNNVTTKK